MDKCSLQGVNPLSFGRPSYSVSINPYPRQKADLTVLFGGNSQTEPNHNVGPQIMDFYLVHYVVSGKGYFKWSHRTIELHPGDSFVIFPGELAQYTSAEDNPWFYRWVAFKGPGAGPLLRDIGLIPQHPVVCAEPIHHLESCFTSIQQVFHEASPQADLLSSGYLSFLIAEYARTLGKIPESGQMVPSPMNKQVDKAIRYMELQYPNPIVIDHLAASFGYHRTHFSKLFKKETGFSPQQYLQNLRMEQAKILMNTTLTIGEIASSVGFQDPLYFSKMFKKKYGASPSLFRG